MVVHAEEVIPILLDAVPSFRPLWESEVRAENEDGEGRLHYLDASAFARHLLERWREGAQDDVRRAFDAIERLHVEGDHYVQELATIGYLKDIQNLAGHANIDPAVFRPYLGAESRRWWNGLNAFWSGIAAAVTPIDEAVPDL